MGAAALLLAAWAAAAPGGPASSTGMFEAVVSAYSLEAKECHKPDRILSERGQKRLAEAINSACARVWPSDPDRADWMFALKLTETYVGPSFRTARTEQTFGPWCLTVFEAREAAKVLGLSLPRASTAVIDVLQDDYRVSALLAAWTLMAYEHTARDRVRGLLIYKYGPTGLMRALDASTGPVTELWPWVRFAARLAEIKCVRDRLALVMPCTCGCLSR